MQNLFTLSPFFLSTPLLLSQVRLRREASCGRARFWSLVSLIGLVSLMSLTAPLLAHANPSSNTFSKRSPAPQRLKKITTPIDPEIIDNLPTQDKLASLCKNSIEDATSRSEIHKARGGFYLNTDVDLCVRVLTQLLPLKMCELNDLSWQLGSFIKVYTKNSEETEHLMIANCGPGGAYHDGYNIIHFKKGRYSRLMFPIYYYTRTGEFEWDYSVIGYLGWAERDQQFIFEQTGRSMGGNGVQVTAQFRRGRVVPAEVRSFGGEADYCGREKKDWPIDYPPSAGRAQHRAWVEKAKSQGLTIRSRKQLKAECLEAQEKKEGHHPEICHEFPFLNDQSE